MERFVKLNRESPLPILELALPLPVNENDPIDEIELAPGD